MCLSDLGKETGIPLKADKLFYYDRNILENIRIVTNSYRVQIIPVRGSLNTENNGGRIFRLKL